MPVNPTSSTTPLGLLAEVRMGVTLRGRDATRPDPNGSCRMIRISDISNEGQLCVGELHRFEPADPIRTDQYLRPGDVLFPNRGVRNTALAFDLDDPQVIVGAQFFLVRPTNRAIDSAYLAWFLRSDVAARYFHERRKGTLVQILERADLTDLPVPVPPLPAQRCIVELDRLATEEARLSTELARLRKIALERRLLGVAQFRSHPPV